MLNNSKNYEIFWNKEN